MAGLFGLVLQYLSRVCPRRGICFALITCICAIPVHAATTYRIGVEELDYYPLYAGRKGEYDGFARDFLDAFAAKQGYNFEYVVLPINRLFKAFLTDREVDFKFPDNPAWQADRRSGLKVFYSKSVVDVTEGLMVRTNKLGQGIAQIKIIGTVRGFTPLPYMDQINSGATLVQENSSFEGLLRQTLAGRVDAAYINVDVGAAVLKDVIGTPNLLRFDRSLPFSLSAFSLSTLDHPDVIRQFDDFLASDQRFRNELVKKYRLHDGSP